LHDPIQIIVGFAIEDIDPGSKTVSGAGSPGLKLPVAKLLDEIRAHRAPSPVRAARKLLAVERTPALIREGRRKDAGVPEPGLPTCIQFRRPVAAKQAVDFLVRGGVAGKPWRKLLHDGKGIADSAFPRAAIDGKILLGRRDRRDRPAHFQRPKLADQFGGRVERAGQIVGKKSQGRHTIRVLPESAFSTAISLLNLTALLSLIAGFLRVINARKMAEKPFEISKGFHINLVQLQPTQPQIFCKRKNKKAVRSRLMRWSRVSTSNP